MINQHQFSHRSVRTSDLFQRRGLGVLCCVALTLFTWASSVLGEEVPALRDSVSEWVAIEKAISREAVAWEEKKVLLADLMALAQTEIQSLEDELAQAAATASAADEQRAALVSEERDLRQATEQILAFIGKMEPRILALRNQLPPPLTSSLEEAFRRFTPSTASEGNRVGERMQALVQILDGVQKFDRNITLTEDVWELADGTSGLVSIVYVGLGVAYYLGQVDSDAGIGRPGKEGWIWDSRPGIRRQVQMVIDSLENKGIAADFVRLPFSLEMNKP